MSFEFYPQVSGEEVIQYHNKLSTQEVEWLIQEIIKPELPSLRDTLQQCHELLISDQELKLPLSSYQSEYIKGVITRRQFQIVLVEVVFKNVKSLNHGRTTRVTLAPGVHNEITLAQLVDCDEFILKSLSKLDEILESKLVDHLQWLDGLHNLLISISTSLNYLKTPNPKYLFPQYRTLSSIFKPQLPDSVSLEFFINDNDLFVEFYELDHVNVKPWCIVNQQTGKSFVDDLKLRISKDRRKSINTIINEEQLKLDISPMDHSITDSISSLFHNQNYKKQENLKFIENCITYEDNRHDKCVVMVKKNIEINVGDPLLMTILMKLASVENNIMKFYENLINVLDD